MTEVNLNARSSDAGAGQAVCDEDVRLAVLASYGVEGLEGDSELTAITQFAAKLCDAPIALVNLIERHEPLAVAHLGLDGAPKIPRSYSLCAYAMQQSGFVEIRDTKADNNVASYSVVADAPGIRFYAGVPLISAEGAPLGALCISDLEPRPDGLTDFQREGLEVLAQSVMRALEGHRERNFANAELASSKDRIQFVLDSLPDIAWSAAPGMAWDYFNNRFAEVTGTKPPQETEDWLKVIHPEDFEASLAKFDHAMKNATMFEDEWRLRHADGSYRWVISRAVPSTNQPDTARWFGTLTDIHARYSISQERELLAGELAHRIKNIFSIIIGLVTLNARGDEKLEGFAAKLSEALRALSRAQSVALQSETTKKGKLCDLLRALTLPYGIDGAGAIAIVGAQVEYGQNAATPLALIIHELATNSAKYGALSVADGSVSISVEETNGSVNLTWQELGGPPTTEPSNQGFGSRLIDMTVKHQLGGELKFDWREEGLHAEILIPNQALAR